MNIRSTNGTEPPLQSPSAVQSGSVAAPVRRPRRRLGAHRGVTPVRRRPAPAASSLEVSIEEAIAGYLAANPPQLYRGGA
jgi:hypothetical protein